MKRLITTQGTKTYINLQGLTGYQNKLKSVRGKVEKILSDLQDAAMARVKRQFDATKGKKIRHDRPRGRAERAMFNSIIRPTKTQSGSYKIPLVDEKVFDQFPYLKAQEEGFGLVTAKQPYRVNPKTGRIFPPPFSTIKKSEVNSHVASFQRRDDKGRFKKGGVAYNRLIRWINVPHQLEARNFILAGKTYIKTFGSKFIKERIEQELKNG